MDHAWLDSLSEDWVSQPRSSGSPAPSLPSLTDTISNSSNPRPPSRSRIPKYNPQKKTWAAPPSNNSPLSERSLNKHNVPASQRMPKVPSKLRDDISNSIREKERARTNSDPSNTSSQFNTVQYTSVKLSPEKYTAETPEWKKRLLQGDVAYGEQKDLFSPAGLENIFRPPAPQTQSPTKLQEQNMVESSVVMPSSPPPYLRPRSKSEVGTFTGQEHNEKDSRSSAPGQMKYKISDESASEFSADDLSRSSNFHQKSVSAHEMENPPSNQDSSILHKPEFIGAGRVISGQSDIRNEELSPIYVSRHDTVGGSIDFATTFQATEVQRRLENIREETPQDTSDDHDEKSQVFSEDVTVASDDYAHNGRYINIRRGGRSQDGSFQKRMLSPSSLLAIDESAMLPEESMQASTPKQLPSMKKTRVSNENRQPTSPVLSSIPQTPHQSPSKSVDKQSQTSSGSPLKLFGTYDTFTNQKLLRRLSQFEDNYEDSENRRLSAPSTQENTRSEINEAFMTTSSPLKTMNTGNGQRPSKKMDSFGAGDLDNYQFSEEMSYDSPRSSSQASDYDNLSLPVLDREAQTQFKFQLEPSPALEVDITTSHRTRQTKQTRMTSVTKNVVSIRRIRPGTGNSESSLNLDPSQNVEDLETPRKRNGSSDGKRLPISPFKDRTPKRRRTLQKGDLGDLDVGEGDHTNYSLQETHQQMQSAVGKKRKDARHDDDQQAVNPQILAMRQILRPRSPTPSQGSNLEEDYQEFSRQAYGSFEKARMVQEKKIAQIQAELDATDGSRLPKALNANQHLIDESRRGSVTTQDFLDEAKKIMAGIRGKARRSGLTSLEESESEVNQIQSPDEMANGDLSQDSYQESTKEPFSRPPSRDGAPIQRLPPKQEDPELLNHLRKYQEMSDVDGIITSSIRNIAMAKGLSDSVKTSSRIGEEASPGVFESRFITDDIIESDPPNIRISENPDMERKRKHSSSTSSFPNGENDFHSQGSTSSSRSIPTGSSRGSDSRRVIAPHTVSHLIPEKLAGMVFDRERNSWVKRKSSGSNSGQQNFLPSDESEDDPFGGIPDLSVDEIEELQRLKSAAAELKDKTETLLEHHKSDHHELPNPDLQPNSSIQKPSLKAARSSSIAGSARGETSLNTKKAETRDEKESEDDVEREISIYEDRVEQVSPPRRSVTISFSSPLISVIPPASDPESRLEEDANGYNSACSEDSPGESNSSVIITKRSTSQRSTSTKTRATSRKISRRVSLGGHNFSMRPVSRIDERDEETCDEDGDSQRQKEVSVLVTTPIALSRSIGMALVTPRPSHEIGTLTLSPLSDFTMHQEDEAFGLNVSYVANNQRHVHGNESQRTLSLAIKDLVEKIAEVEPYEPFWEHIKEMDLSRKQLANVHKLDEFCGQLEELNISNNMLSQLDGISRSVRHLRITHNCLTDLTSWGHLSNLQYIDVSNNELESLSAFKNLVHLRSLRAENNLISSLDGIGKLDGLMSLRLRCNLVESIDFKNTRLRRLVDLDLKSNRVNEIQNLSELLSLSDLNLEDNRLDSFPVANLETPSTLRYLRLSGNNLSSIDVNSYPDLRLLYLDRNHLGKITGLLKTKHLDSLSLREQQDGTTIDTSFLPQALEVRKLFLSGNLIHKFDPNANFLNLQYLELANCGIESLPEDFGFMVPNMRVLNLNFNAIKDLMPLTGIVRLKKLHLAGNRLRLLTGKRRTTSVLSQFLGLSLLDLRGNPLTLGFYPPVMDTSLVARNTDVVPEVLEPFTVGKAGNMKDAKYAACLDMPTRMLRRVFEMLVLSGCLHLKTLDGLDVNRSVLKSRDIVWESLVLAGIIITPKTDRETNSPREEFVKQVDPDREPHTEPNLEKIEVCNQGPEERWLAEDGFA